MHNRPFLQESPAVIDSMLHFVGKVVGLLIVAVVAIGMVVILGAIMIGCSPEPSQSKASPQPAVWTGRVWLVTTPAGSYCVESNVYVVKDGCVLFAVVGYRSEVYCGVVQVQPTVPQRCRTIPPLTLAAPPEAQP